VKLFVDVETLEQTEILLVDVIHLNPIGQRRGDRRHVVVD